MCKVKTISQRKSRLILLLHSTPSRLYIQSARLCSGDMRACCAGLRPLLNAAGPSRLPSTPIIARRAFTTAPTARQSVPTPSFASNSQTSKRSSIFDLTKVKGSDSIKPFYVTTPIFYVNACGSSHHFAAPSDPLTRPIYQIRS